MTSDTRGVCPEAKLQYVVRARFPVEQKHRQSWCVDEMHGLCISTEVRRAYKFAAIEPVFNASSISPNRSFSAFGTGGERNDIPTGVVLQPGKSYALGGLAFRGSPDGGPNAHPIFVACQIPSVGDATVDE
jgi:hypothetical protein